MSEGKLPEVPDDIVLDEMIAEEVPVDDSQLEKTEVMQMSDILAELGLEEEKSEIVEDMEDGTAEIEFSSLAEDDLDDIIDDLSEDEEAPEDLLEDEDDFTAQEEDDIPLPPLVEEELPPPPFEEDVPDFGKLTIEDIESQEEPTKAELPPTLKWLRDVDLQEQLSWIDHLRSLDELKRLDQLKNLEQLNRLDKLELINGLDQLDKLSQLAQLKKIDDLKSLEKLHQLDRLGELKKLDRLDELIELHRLDVLEGLKHLDSLEILNSHQTQKTLDSLSKLDKVDELRELLSRRWIFILKGIAMVLVHLTGIVLVSLLIVYGLFTSKKDENVLKILSFLTVDEKMITDFSMKTLEQNLSDGEFKEFLYKADVRINMLADRFWDLDLPYSTIERASLVKNVYAFDFNSKDFPIQEKLLKRMSSQREKHLETLDRSFERLKREANFNEEDESLLLEYKILTYKGQCEKASEVVWSSDFTKYRNHEFMRKSIILNLDCAKGNEVIVKKLEKI